MERYNYADINASENGNREVNTHRLSLSDMPYDLTKGVSFNLLNMFQTASTSKSTAKRYMFESLQAMDEELTKNPDPGLAFHGVDGLDDYLKKQKITRFSISEGFIDFKNEKNELVLSLPILSQRQRLLRESFYTKEVKTRRELAQEIVGREEEEMREQHEKEQKKAAREQQAARWRMAREAALQTIGQADDSIAVEVKLPQLGTNPFKVPSSYWIRSETPPVVLAGNKDEKYVCMAHVGELLAQDLGKANLQSLGYVEGGDAWELKRNLISKNGAVELAPDLSKYVKIISTGKNLGLKDTATGDAYRSDASQLWDTLNTAAAEGKPLVLPFYNRFSSYKKEVAHSNARLKGEKSSLQSLNTHVAYSLGKEFRPLKESPLADETAQAYLLRIFGIPPESAWVLNKGEIRVNGKEASLNTPLNSDDKVEYSDFWFSHHIKGSQVTSLAEFLGNGQFVPTGLLQLNTEVLDKASTPSAPKDSRLNPSQVHYLSPGQSLYDFFQKKVSTKPEAWDQYKLYLQLVGVNDRSLSPLDPIPVPDFSKLEAYLTEVGGPKSARANYEKERAKRYTHENPGEQLLLIEANATPWDLLSPLFSSVSPLNSKERQFVLESIDRLNSSIDLRTFQAPSGHQEYLKWQAGNFIWTSDEVVEALKQQIEYERIQERIHVPPELDLATKEGPKKVLISQEKRDVIEQVTSDPEMRTYLTLLLLNEQEGGEARHWAARQLEEKSGGLWKEGSIGLFQVVPDPNNWEQVVKEEGYSFPDFEAYRQALIDDPILNARVAIRVIKDVRKTYGYFLKKNGEEPNPEDKNYVAMVLTMYNRPSTRVINGLFSYNAQTIAESFGIELAMDDPFHLGKDRELLATHWAQLGQALNEKGKISLSEEEILSDAALLEQALQSSGSKYTLETLPPLFKEHPGAYLLVLNKSFFLQSQFYKKISEAYEATTGLKLSLVLDETGFEKTKIANYGYRVTRHEQLAEIVNYSYGLNILELEKRGLKAPRPLEELDSVHRRQVVPPSVAGDTESGAESASGEVIPFKVDLSPEELAKYPVNKNGLVSILFTGGRGSSDRHGGGIPDAIKQILIDPKTGVTTIVDLPRDLRVSFQAEDGTQRNSRLNAVRRFGKEAAFRGAIEEITGQDVVNSVNFDFETVMQNIDKIIDIVGNIEIRNPNDESYVGRSEGNHFYPSPTVLTTGADVLHYARFRKGWVVNDAYDPSILDKDGHPLDPDESEIKRKLDGTDTQRSQRQTLVMQTIMNKVLDHWVDILPLLPELLSTVETDIAVTEIPDYMRVGDRVKESRKINPVAASGKIKPMYSGLEQKKYQGEALKDKTAYVRAINVSFEKPDSGGA